MIPDSSTFDVYCFRSRHARRTTVQTEDVKLLARRNHKLVKDVFFLQRHLYFTKQYHGYLQFFLRYSFSLKTDSYCIIFFINVRYVFVCSTKRYVVWQRRTCPIQTAEREVCQPPGTPTIQRGPNPQRKGKSPKRSLISPSPSLSEMTL